MVSQWHYLPINAIRVNINISNNTKVNTVTVLASKLHPNLCTTHPFILLKPATSLPINHRLSHIHPTIHPSNHHWSNLAITKILGTTNLRPFHLPSYLSFYYPTQLPTTSKPLYFLPISFLTNLLIK